MRQEVELAIRLGKTPADVWALDPEQLDLMIAFVEIEHDIGPHGVPMSEATDSRADPNYRGPGAFRYLVHRKVDQVQRAINIDARAMSQQLGDNDDQSDVRRWVERVDYD